jgi:hypothetical protein
VYIGWLKVDYKVCSIMLKGRVKKKINLDEFYQILPEKYQVEYNPEVSNRMIVHLPEASILFFASGTIQIYLRNPKRKEETIAEANRMISLIHPHAAAIYSM